MSCKNVNQIMANHHDKHLKISFVTVHNRINVEYERCKKKMKKSSNASTTIKTTKNNDNSLYSIEIVFAIENGDFRSL